MSSKVTESLTELSKLSAAEQERGAEAILDFASGATARPILTEEQPQEVRHRLADPKPNFVTLAEAKARLALLSARGSSSHFKCQFTANRPSAGNGSIESIRKRRTTFNSRHIPLRGGREVI